MNTIFQQDKDFDGASVGIYKNNDGTFTAMTRAQSRNFKTYKGAEKNLCCIRKYLKQYNKNCNDCINNCKEYIEYITDNNINE